MLKLRLRHAESPPPNGLPQSPTSTSADIAALIVCLPTNRSGTPARGKGQARPAVSPRFRASLVQRGRSPSAGRPCGRSARLVTAARQGRDGRGRAAKETDNGQTAG